jgi:two-component system, cell cycle sensor histidine kinase and response regulator CckA
MPRPILTQHILVVDDEPMVRDALKMVLTFEGHTVELASDGPEALQKVAEQKFDIIFTDYKMPQMSGDDLARCIKRQYPCQVVVMVTAYAGFLSPSQKRTMPVDFIITKPFDLQTILNAVRRACQINKSNRKKAGPSRPPPSTPP